MIHEAQNDCILKAIAPARASGMAMICHNTAPLFVTNDGDLSHSDPRQPSIASISGVCSTSI